MHLRVFERVSELVLPEPCFGWILCFKKEEFRVRKACFFTTGEKREKNKPVLSEAQTNAQKLSKREVKREIRGVCAFSVFAHQNTLRRFGLRAYFLRFFFFFSPQHIKAPTLCARRKITINIHTERGLRKERTFHDARNTTTIIRSRERLVVV